MPDRPHDQRVADELAIRNIVARLAQLADMGDLDDYLKLWTEDASWEMPGAPARKGHADILQGAKERRANGMQGPGTSTRHVVTTLSVQLDGADAATADSYFLYVADTTTSPRLGSVGHYHDTFRGSTDGWRMARRQITFG
jgi:3-phenylpropionate/cinnamic acid dioxygenase small subunit